MSIRTNASNSQQKPDRKTTKLGIEQLESRLMNSIDNLESSLQLLNAPSLFGSTQMVSSLTTNAQPTVASPLRLNNGSTVTGRTASLSVSGSDDSGELGLKYKWTMVSAPIGGTIQFGTNNSNAAKNNTVTFNKTGSYQLLVAITDVQGLSTSSTLEVSVVPTLSSLVVRTQDGRPVSSTNPFNSSDIRRNFTVQGLDQFGVLMTAQPTVNWQTVSAPLNGSVSYNSEGAAVAAIFNRAGSYVVKAESGTVNTLLNLNVTQSLTFLDVATTSGVPIDPSQPVSVTTKTNQLVVRGFDQFGDPMASMPRVTFASTIAPSGGAVSATLANGVTTLAFTRIGNYSVRVQSGLTSFSFNANVIPTLTSIGIRNSEGRAIATGTSPNTSGSGLGLSAVGLDQYGGLLESQPEINWTAGNSPSGGVATLSNTGNGVAASFNRAGEYTLRAQFGSVFSNIKVNVLQTVTALRLSANQDIVVDPNIPVIVEKTNQRLTVQAIDQFGNIATHLPSINWSTISSPTGGAARANDTSGTPTITFTRAGTYTLRARAGSVFQLITFNVASVMSSIVAYTENNRPISTGSSLPVSGQNAKLTARAFDQFGRALATEPSFEWSLVSAPAGTSASVQQTGTLATISFLRAGNYAVRISAGTVTQTVTINVLQTVTSISITPGPSSISTNSNLQFRFQAVDQFGQSLSNPPTAVWTANGGTITATGLLSSGTKAGKITVTAKWGKFVASSIVEVTAPAPTPAPTPTPTPSPSPTPSGPLRNAALASLVNSLYSDNQLTRNEVIQLLKSVGSDGLVDANELADLRFISSSSSIYAMPAFVRELAKDVVNSNPANGTFKGQAAGNLTTGSSATLLNNLVDKWFLGADEPVLTSSNYSYQTVVGNLFNGTPSRGDARQGQLGDCYFIASLASIADKNPDAVRNLFIDNSDGTYTVRFYVDGKTDYVTVNRRLPSSTGQLRYSGYGQSITSTSTTLWIALAEKAYAQWNETGNSGRNGTNTYASIEGGWMSYVNAQVLGYSSSNYSFSTTPKQTLLTALSAGRSVTLGTKQGSADGLYGSHAYTVTGYDAATDTFNLHNPWGNSHPGALSWTQLQANCTSFTVADPSGSVGNNLASVRSSMSETFVGNWTTIITVRVTATQDISLATSELEQPDAFDSILHSTLNSELETPSLANDLSPKRALEDAAPIDGQLASPLSASLVDLAMSQLSLGQRLAISPV